jgi:dephospho-CoA kinase
MLREGMTNEEVLMRMSKQWPDDQKRTYADYIIYNDEENPLINQILKLHSIFSDSK